MEMPGYNVTENDITIYGSCDIEKKDFRPILENIASGYPENEVVKTRFYYSAMSEWATHNFLYNLGLWRASTISVDINLIKWYTKLAYYICGTLVYPFIK